MPRAKLPNIDQQLEDLGGGSLDRLTDGTWVFSDAEWETVHAGATPSQAIREAWLALPTEDDEG